MLYEIIHTHDGETCPGGSQERGKSLSNWWQGLKKTAGIKVLSAYVAPLEHTFYITVDADDYATLVRSVAMLMSFGTGRIIPVLSLEQTLPMVEAGVFRVSK